MRHAFLGFLSPTMRVRAGFYPPQVPSRGFARRSAPCLALSCERVCGCRHPCGRVGDLLPFRAQGSCPLSRTKPFDSSARPGFAGCPHALFAPCLHTCRACLIPTASLGFSLQRIDFVQSRKTLSVRRALLFLGWSRRRHFRRLPCGAGRSFGRLIGFQADCARISQVADARTFAVHPFGLTGPLARRFVFLRSAKQGSVRSGAASRAAGHCQSRLLRPRLPRSSRAFLVDVRWSSAVPFVLRRSCVIAPSAMGQGSPVSTVRVATVRSSCAVSSRSSLVCCSNCRTSASTDCSAICMVLNFAADAASTTCRRLSPSVACLRFESAGCPVDASPVALACRSERCGVSATLHAQRAWLSPVSYFVVLPRRRVAPSRPRSPCVLESKGLSPGRACLAATVFTPSTV